MIKSISLLACVSKLQPEPTHIILSPLLMRKEEGCLMSLVYLADTRLEDRATYVRWQRHCSPY